MLFPDPPVIPLPFLVRTIGQGHLQEPVRRSHGYPAYHWLQVRSGVLRFGFEDALLARPGDGLFLQPDEPHAYLSLSGPLLVDWITFSGSGVAAVLTMGPLNQSGVYRLTSAHRVVSLMERAWQTASEPHPAAGLSVAVYELLLTLAEDAAGARQSSATDRRGRLEPVLQALSHDPAYPWTVPEMAALLGQTPQSLGRQFRDALGCAPLEYLVRLRLGRAQRLLAERPDLRIHEVGKAVGWNDTNYFVRLFRTREGLTPGQFRSLHLGEPATL
jgi:AraC-like DNA-binding protein